MSTSTRIEELMLARSLAEVMHADQKRLDGAPYMGHVHRVVALASGVKAETVAYLHDIVEDTPITLEILALMFSPDIVEAVDAISRRVGEKYDDYIARVIDSGEPAIGVKLADLRHNMASSGNGYPGQGLFNRYEKAYARLIEASA